MSLKSAFAGALPTLIALVFAGVALSQTPPKEGKYEVTSCSSAVLTSIAFSPTHSASNWELMGMNVSNPPGGLLDKATFRCVGLSSMLDGKNSARWVCELVDAEGGSKLLSYWTNEDGKTTRTHYVGTGKFEGIELTTTAESLGLSSKIKPGTFQTCGRNTGTYKLK